MHHSGTDTAAAEPGAYRSAAAPTLYYQDRLVTLYHGDCLTDPSLWTGAAVMITDPPYGLQKLAGGYGFRSSRRGSVTIANDLDTTVRDAVLELWGDKPVAMFGTPRLEEPPGGWSDRLVWDKAQLGLNGGAWRYAHETIFVRGDGWQRLSDSSSSILRHSTQKNRAHVARHIHSKPEKLLADLITAAPDGLIVDPFAGGGSTIAAARALGRPIVAFELEEHYCDAIVERITSRLDLFEPGDPA
ncbi:DNA methyltransferase [Microbacterium sp. NIBRBAC000506063]|uniref:DNA methyltransferase n=1 Tax=Microbacterium sp. NIBRBAC000506063 TaxID=2734618 RepID=UPI001BB76736|nr:DNA methyltransferase [Microbacterium sp. NIBRBAC000506063]QTV79448.1 site-specific DNA-methyltransferase [Microbacterium sp. NIBRBAC000506063]